MENVRMHSLGGDAAKKLQTYCTKGCSVPATSVQRLCNKRAVSLQQACSFSAKGVQNLCSLFSLSYRLLEPVDDSPL
ncbi:MAG: hypothetical protein K2L60_06915 [Bacteroides sp.]|nr:hypothetical protein [Bacteroides sp.]